MTACETGAETVFLGGQMGGDEGQYMGMNENKPRILTGE